jgi:hypothetical protein
VLRAHYRVLTEAKHLLAIVTGSDKPDKDVTMIRVIAIAYDRCCRTLLFVRGFISLFEANRVG